MKLTLKTLKPFVLGCLVLFACAVHADVISGRVVDVMDGDTINVLDTSNTRHRIRLEGIDAPEKAQPFGARSKQHLSNQIFGKQVQVQWSKIDRYGRTIGKVLINGSDINLEQVRSGLAWHYKEYQKEQSASDRVAYAAAETYARGIQLGLWSDMQAIAPWDWRRERKTGKLGIFQY